MSAWDGSIHVLIQGGLRVGEPRGGFRVECKVGR